MSSNLNNWTIHSEHCHFKWDNSIEPVIKVASGDTVALDVNDSSAGVVKPDSTSEIILKCEEDQANPVTGPIWVESAEPGDTVAVTFLDYQPSGWGWTGIFPDFGLLQEDFNQPEIHIWNYDKQASKPTMFGDWAKVDIKPFVGTIGVAPKEDGPHSIIPPGSFGGNMDCKDLVEGSILYLPVQVPGALLSVGDTHAAQGDGEVCGTAIESAMKVAIKIELIKGGKVYAPRVVIPSYEQRTYRSVNVTMGIGPDLYIAAQESVKQMIDLITSRTQMPPEKAYMLCSVCGDLKISEIVDQPNFVVSFYFPFDVFE